MITTARIARVTTIGFRTLLTMELSPTSMVPRHCLTRHMTRHSKQLMYQWWRMKKLRRTIPQELSMVRLMMEVKIYEVL